MKIPIEVTVDVDAWAWTQRFGLAANAVEFDVQEYFARLILKELRELGLAIPLDPNTISGVRAFRDDDGSYLSWVTAHPDGFVINIRRSYNKTDARVHRAACPTISGQKVGGKAWTDQYVKVCAERRDDLLGWTAHQFEAPILPCGTCRPDRDAAQPSPVRQATKTAAAAAPEGRCDIHEPSGDRAIVEAWADDYIRFERRPAWQEQLRTKIRSCCQELEPSPEQVLHATFFGAKPANADVENLVLYNIDTFRVAGRYGIRFEHGDAVPPAPDDAAYRFGYRYALTPHSGTFTDWQQRRTLASFDWTDLGAFAGEKKLAQVWLELCRARLRGDVDVCEPATPETPFAVRVQIRPPVERQPVVGGLVKGIFDGVICGFQVQTDTADVAEVVERLATDLPASPAEIEEHVFNQRGAVLGPVHRLVSLYGAGVKWNPSDHLCVAGELLLEEPVDERWAIKGDIVELSR